MPRRENYTPLIAAATIFSIAILVAFQLNQMQEPARMEADAASDFASSVIEGNFLYGVNCANCHGEKGEGSIGPSLRTKAVLEDASLGQLIGLVKTGIPSTTMPAWSQAYGGSLTDEEVKHVVTYITTWVLLEAEESIAAEGQSTPNGDGLTLFAANCAACHGAEGEGGIGPDLHSNVFINGLTDEALIEFILAGRPGTAMPGFEGQLLTEDTQAIVLHLRAWQ